MFDKSFLPPSERGFLCATSLCWGSGALGDGVHELQRTQPVTVANVRGNVTALAASAYHYCALMNDQLWCWGSAGYVGHGLSSDALTPVPITSP